MLLYDETVFLGRDFAIRTASNEMVLSRVFVLFAKDSVSTHFLTLGRRLKIRHVEECFGFDFEVF